MAVAGARQAHMLRIDGSGSAGVSGAVVPDSRVLNRPAAEAAAAMADVTWHVDADVPSLRQAVSAQMLALMQAGGPDAWAAPLAAFIADLESELLHSARSKEEYGDIGTLDARVQAVTERTLRRPVPTPAPTQQPAAGGSGAQTAPMSKADCQQRIRRQHQWLLWLRHCAKCQLTDQECRLRSCKAGKELWEHILACRAPDCKHPCCTSCKGLLKHYQQCQHASCATCGPVKAWIRQSLAGAAV